MIIKDIVTKRTYKVIGEEKTIWNKVGLLRNIEGKIYVDMFTFPDTTFYVFDQKPKEEQKAKEPVIDPETGIDVSQIPF